MEIADKIQKILSDPERIKKLSPQEQMLLLKMFQFQKEWDIIKMKKEKDGEKKGE